MEIYSNTTRFALACNTSSKIIEPIQSRCAIVRYSKLGEKDILERLLHVCQHEKVRWAFLKLCLMPQARMHLHVYRCLPASTATLMAGKCTVLLSTLAHLKTV